MSKLNVILFFLSRLGFLLFLRRSICELNSLCKDCHCDVLAARDEIAADELAARDESEDESYVQPSTSSGSNTDWLGGQWLHEALSVCSCKFKFEVEFHLTNYFVSWWSQSKPCPKHKKIIVEWTYVIYLVFGHGSLVSMVLSTVCGKTPAACCILQRIISLCVGGKKASITEGGCICWWVEFSMISPLGFFDPYWIPPHHQWDWLLIGPLLPWGQNTIAPQRRTFYSSIFGSQVFR